MAIRVTTKRPLLRRPITPRLPRTRPPLPLLTTTRLLSTQQQLRRATTPTPSNIPYLLSFFFCLLNGHLIFCVGIIQRFHRTTRRRHTHQRRSISLLPSTPFRPHRTHTKLRPQHQSTTKKQQNCHQFTSTDQSTLSPATTPLLLVTTQRLLLLSKIHSFA